MRADSSTISLTDEAALSWYFGQGLSIYQRSTFGAIIDRLTTDSYSSTSCKTCGGGGIMEHGGIDVSTRCKTCSGSGKIAEGHKWCPDCKGFGVVAQYEVECEFGGWCKACRGTGMTAVHRTLKLRTPCTVCGKRVKGRTYGREAGCSHCLGTGHEPISAKPIHGPPPSGGVQADDSELTRFAITSRRVERVRTQSPALATALSVYYGDVGQRWALTDRGRLFSLYHLTGPGRKLARWGEREKGADLDLTAQERIGTQAALEAGQPKRERFALLLAAGQAASELYGRAARAWNRASSSKRERATWERLAGSLAELGHGELGEAVKRRAKAMP